MVMLATFRVEEELLRFASREIVSMVLLLSDWGDIISVNKLINLLLNRSYIYILNSNLIRAYFIKVMLFIKLLKMAFGFI